MKEPQKTAFTRNHASQMQVKTDTVLNAYIKFWRHENGKVSQGNG